jgi:hypothetical protein
MSIVRTAAVASLLCAVPGTAAARGQSEPRLRGELTKEKARALTSRVAAVEGPDIRVQVDTGGRAAKDLDVHEMKGPAGTGPVALETADDVATLRLQRGQCIVVKPKTPEAVALSGKTYMPGFAAWSPAQGEPRAVTFRVFLQGDPLPMRWDPTRGAYTTSLVVGVDATENDRPVPSPAFPAALAGGVRVELLCRDAKAAQTPVTIATPGVNGYARVDVTAGSWDLSPTVSARCNFGDGDCAIAIAPELSGIVVSPAKTRVRGYGLETLDVTITRMTDGGGTPWPAEEPLDVEVRADAGQIPSSARIDPGQSRVVVELRSTGTGPVGLTASAGRLSHRSSVEFVWPLAFLILVTVSGVVGGIARVAVVKSRRRGGTKRTKPKNTTTTVLLAGFTGLLVVVAALLGMNLMQVPPYVVGTEAGAALVAAMGGYVGPALIDRMAKMLRGGKTE